MHSDITRVAFIGQDVGDDFSSVEDNLGRLLEGLLKHQRFCEFYVGRENAFDKLATAALQRAKSEAFPNSFSLWLVWPHEKRDACKFSDAYDGIVFPVSPEHPNTDAAKRKNDWLLCRCNLLIAHIAREDDEMYDCLRTAAGRNVSVVYV